MNNSAKAHRTIFSTGVELQAEECIINGITQWRWIATSFEDDSYLNGNVIIPLEYAVNPDNLIQDE